MCSENENENDESESLQPICIKEEQSKCNYCQLSSQTNDQRLAHECLVHNLQVVIQNDVALHLSHTSAMSIEVDKEPRAQLQAEPITEPSGISEQLLTAHQADVLAATNTNLNSSIEANTVSHSLQTDPDEIDGRTIETTVPEIQQISGFIQPNLNRPTESDCAQNHQSTISQGYSPLSGFAPSPLANEVP